MMVSHAEVEMILGHRHPKPKVCRKIFKSAANNAEISRLQNPCKVSRALQSNYWSEEFKCQSVIESYIAAHRIQT